VTLCDYKLFVIFTLFVVYRRLPLAQCSLNLIYTQSSQYLYKRRSLLALALFEDINLAKCGFSWI